MVFDGDGRADTMGLRADWRSSRPILTVAPRGGRTSTVVGLRQRESVGHAGAGFGLSRSMRRRMSANRFFGMATSAIWNVT